MSTSKRERRSRVARLLLVLLVAAGCAGGDEAPAARETAATPPKVEGLSNTFDSIYALGEAILEGFTAGDRPALMSYRVDEAEWYHIVWPELPASRPERNLPWEYVWGELDQKSRAELTQTLDWLEGSTMRLVRVQFDGETTEYETFRVHRDARCVVERADGEIVTLDLFGSVIERNGRFKAFSYVVD